ncbi:MAG: acetate/propionate family kinase [Candidatus Paraimprobicoccus trichonymphae]|uniref:Acetate kinase n=1 Tax=Candidatus Paraimprobicoccus trichonymphae TaxID=3033793 RepID=A0AA48IBC3_9FIRM|nr:MAG: acetate/propionate family kinase [Candidatus Paraimprobicoccus trichonymphae]
MGVIFIKFFVINSGSSTLKYKIFDENKNCLLKGTFDNLNSDKLVNVTQENYNKKIYKENFRSDDYHHIFNKVKDLILDSNFGVINNLEEISAVGHRVVHGGTFFKNSVIITKTVEGEIEKLVELAPLHNRANLNGILACEKIFKNIPQIAVFDTNFYSKLPEISYILGIPYEYYEKYNIRKYGFHGISHKYVIEKYSEMSGKDTKNLKIISCHLGNGSSITAVNNNKVVDTSMEFTPLGGFIMGTRSGSIDPSIVTYLAKKENLDFSEIENILNKKSGLLGISGISSDKRLIMSSLESNKRAKLAFDIFIYQITKYIGGYITLLKGLDVLIFTGGIGENQYLHREKIGENLGFLNLNLNQKLNKITVLGREGKISSDNSKIDVFVISTNEELAILNEILKLII